MTETIKPLRPYQLEAGTAILKSVYAKKGLTFSVEIARQGGKNELSSHLELWLLADFAGENKNLIKCSPTFKPQTIISMMRLKEKLDLAGLNGSWAAEMGYIIRLGKARAIFLSAEESSNVVGNTAHLLLEVDEAQDVKEEKYSKEFKPMGSTANVTSVLYGTTWDDSTLLEKTKQQNLDLELKDGLKRHFRYDWQEVAKYNPEYLAYVESEKERLGENHPLFLTQYRLLPVRGGGGFLNGGQKAQMQGQHSRRGNPEAGKIYIAGIDLAGEAETREDDFLKALKPGRDSTVMTIGEIEKECKVPFIFDSSPARGEENGRTEAGMTYRAPANIKIVEHYAWTGRKHPELYPQLIDLIKNVWHCRRVVIDATGIGQPVASFLRNELGPRIVPFVFSPSSKTKLAFNLLASINSGGLKMYAADNSEEFKEFWFQMDKAKSFYRPNQTLNFFVDPADGHDDYLMSLALLAEANRGFQPREAQGHDGSRRDTGK